jgi:CRISPR-associated protein Csx10
MGSLKITLHSDLCAGSGESAGNAIDTDLCIHASGLPYLPARRLKGCMRRAAEELAQYGCEEATDENIEALFGNAFGKEGKLRISDAALPGAEAMQHWLRTSVPEELKTAAHPANVAKLFAYVRGQTKMENGVKADGTLRFTRVLDRYDALRPGQETVLFAPAWLEGATEAETALMRKCCMATRHIGTHRNRGLGNVSIEWLPDEPRLQNPQAVGALPQGKDPQARVRISYKVALDAPITLPGCAEQQTAIPARSVIGCAAAQYLKKGKAEEEMFHDLFLNGTVSWSALTPVIDGKRSAPTPLTLVYLKNEDCYINQASEKAEELADKKRKTLEGTYAVQVENGYHIASVRSHTLYHHQIGSGEEESVLYMQSSLDEGMLYGGTVDVPASLAQTVCALLQTMDMRFGRSRSAQYAACSLAEGPNVEPLEAQTVKPAAGETIYVVLRSDLILAKDGLYETETGAVRAALAQKLGLQNTDKPQNASDRCLYHTVGGYQAQWQLQKPQIPAVRGGSVYCFVADGQELPAAFRLGEYAQEGFGQCLVQTERQMKALGRVSKTEVDRKQPQEDAAQIQRLQTALIVAAARQHLAQAAYQYYREHRRELNEMGHGLIGRLRRMLDEAEDLNDMRARADSIKPSDASAEKPTTHKETAQKLLENLYGAQEEPMLPHLLQQAPALLELAKNDASAQAQIEAEWKALLARVLHLAYYGGMDKEKEG